MKCKNCGNEYEGNFCPACGTPAEKSTLVPRTCAKCGNQYEGNFCPACGTPAASTGPVYSQGSAPMPPRSKKGHGCLVAILIVVAFFVLVGIIGTATESSTTDSSTPTPSPIASLTETPVETPAETPTATPDETTPAPTEDSTSPSDSTPDTDSGLGLTMDEVVPLLDSIIAQNFDEDKYSLEYDDTGITLSMWEDGLALGAALAAAGNADAKASWDEMTDNIIYMSDSMTEALNTLGFQDTVVTVNILNEQNTDNVLLCTVNGVVIYDATAE